MANLLGRKKTPSTDVDIPANPQPPRLQPRSQVASASRIRFDGTGWKNYKFGSNLWQVEGWRHYDICGELHGVTNAVANLGSRVEFNIHRIENGKPGAKITEDDDPQLAALGAEILGGAEKAPENQRLAFVNLFVAGEYFQFVESPVGESVDRWFIISVTQLTRAQDGSGKLQFDRPHEYGGGKVDYDPNDGTGRTGILERCWTPHGQLSDHADSSVRAAITVLNLIEQYNKRSSAQNDSRLAGAGVMFLPDTFDFPAGDDQSPVDAFEARLGTEMGRTLEDPANARSLVPVMATARAEDIDKINWLTFETPLDEQTKDRLDQCIRRLATSLDVPPSVLLGGESSSHWCVDEQTEALTTEGWRKQTDLNVGDVVLTLNHETGLAEWKPVTFIYRADVASEPMLAIERGNHSSLTTRDHRWPVLRQRERNRQKVVSREFVLSEELTNAHRIVTAAPCADIPTTAKYSDELVELAAWFWTEGSTNGVGANIIQSHTFNPHLVARIRACLTRMYGPAKDSLLQSQAVAAWREDVWDNPSGWGGAVTTFSLNKKAATALHDVAPAKRVRLDFIRSLTAAQLELFIDVSCKGDGWHYKQGRMDVWQRDKDALDAFELAMILSGRMVTWGEHADGHVVTPWRGRDSVRPMKSLAGQHEQVWQEYTGTIWCPKTENSTWLARRNGTVYYTGNTAWKDAEDTVTTFVAPLAARVAECVTGGWLHPILTELGYNPDEYMVWYDLAPLLVKPDRHQDAMNLWDRGLINDEAARRLSGVKEADAHTEETYRAWLLSKLILAGSPLLQDPNFSAQLGIGGAPAPAPAAVTADEQPPTRTEPPRSPEQEALVAGAEMAALHSLAVAGKKMLTRGVRDQLMTEFAGRPFDLHTRLNVESMDHAMTLLDGTWDLLPALSRRTGTDPRILRDVLGFYCSSQMASGIGHNPDTLTFLLSEGILAAGHRRCTSGCGNPLHPQKCTAPAAVTA